MTMDISAKMPPGANAPYKIQVRGKKFVVVNNAGEVKATFATRKAAEDYQKALYANVPGATKRAAKVPWTGKAKNRAPKTAKACLEEDCARSFLDEASWFKHVETVHPGLADVARSLLGQDVDLSRSISAKERKTMAGKGQAMSDGSFPIANRQDLLNAITSWGRAKNKAAAKAHIIKRAKALGCTSDLPKSWTSESAQRIECPDCADRAFRTEDLFVEHAEAVHTFDDTRMIVMEALREKYGSHGPNVSYQDAIYVYIQDIATDWVVFVASRGGEEDLYKCSYAITDGNTVTLGALTEVKRRTVYDAVGDGEPTGVLGDPQNLNSGGNS